MSTPAGVRARQLAERKAATRLPDRAAEHMRRVGFKLKGRTLVELGWSLDLELAHPGDPIVAVTGEKSPESRLYAPASWLQKGGGALGHEHA